MYYSVMILKRLKLLELVGSRTYKNFGHKRQPVPGVTVLWHGFLTFTFIGLAIEWKKIAHFIFGDDHGVDEAPWQIGSKKEDSLDEKAS